MLLILLSLVSRLKHPIICRRDHNSPNISILFMYQYQYFANTNSVLTGILYFRAKPVKVSPCLIGRSTRCSQLGVYLADESLLQPLEVLLPRPFSFISSVPCDENISSSSSSPELQQRPDPFSVLESLRYLQFLQCTSYVRKYNLRVIVTRSLLF